MGREIISWVIIGIGAITWAESTKGIVCKKTQSGHSSLVPVSESAWKWLTEAKETERKADNKKNRIYFFIVEQINLLIGQLPPLVSYP